MVRLKCAGCRKESCNGCSLYQQINTGKNESSVFPEDFVPDRGKGLGMVFDVGTTTIAGLLPRIPLERISHIGNCAGTGASMALLSAQAAREMEQDAQMIQHVELADEDGFQACFLESLQVR